MACLTNSLCVGAELGPAGAANTVCEAPLPRRDLPVQPAEWGSGQEGGA